MKIDHPRAARCTKYFNDLILNELSDFNVCVAGGAVRSWFAMERQSDIDLFFDSEESRDKALKQISDKDDSEVVFENDNVTKVKWKRKVFDFCKSYYPDPESTIADFDFTVSMAAVSSDGLFVGKDFFMDLASKRLAFNNIPFPMSSLHRFQKYIKKGYWMCKDEMIKFTGALQKVDITTLDAEPEDDPESNSGSNPFPGMD